MGSYSPPNSSPGRGRPVVTQATISVVSHDLPTTGSAVGRKRVATRPKASFAPAALSTSASALRSASIASLCVLVIEVHGSALIYISPYT